MIKNIHFLGIFSLFFLLSNQTFGSPGDTTVYSKPCSDYTRTAIKTGEKQYTIIEKKGNNTLFESDIEYSKITYEMLSSEVFRRGILRGSHKIKLYNYNGQLRFEIRKIKNDSVILKVYDDEKLTYEYLFVDQRINKILEELKLDEDGKELSKKILSIRAARISVYANGALFCTYTQLNDGYSSYYTQQIIKDKKTIQKNVCALGYTVSQDEPEKKDYMLFTSLSGMTKHQEQFSFPQVEYHPDYSIKTRQNLVGSNLTTVRLSKKGRLLDTSFSHCLRNSTTVNSPNYEVALLHAERYDEDQNELFYYHTDYSKDKVTVTWRTKVRDSLITIKKEISPETWHRNMGQKFPEIYGDTPQVSDKKYSTKIYYKRKLLKSYPTSLGFLEYDKNKILSLFNLFSQEEEYTKTPFIREADPQNKPEYIRADYLLRGKRMLSPILKDTIIQLATMSPNSLFTSYKDENLKIKKDFVSCLFGVWSQSAASYEIPCKYMEIQKINSSYYQVTSDFSDYQIINLKNEVVFETQEKPNVRQHRNYYVVQARDSSFVFDNNWALIHTTDKAYSYYTIKNIRNSLIIYEKDIDESRIFSKNVDSVQMISIPGELSYLQIKTNNNLNELVYNTNNIYQVLPEGPKLIHQTTDSLSTVRINYKSTLVSVHKNEITIYGADNEHFTKYNLVIDDFYKWVYNLKQMDDYTYRGSKNSGLLIYQYAGKKGLLSSTLLPILSPEWDDISIQHHILKKAENLYLFDNYGNTSLLPNKMVKLETKTNRYRNDRDNTTLVYYDDKTLALSDNKFIFNFLKPIQTVGIFSTSFNTTNDYKKNIAIVAVNGDLYVNSGSLFTKDQSATGTFQDAESGQSILYSEGKKIGTSYDKVYQVGQMEYLNPLLTAAIQVKATDGTHTYKIDLNDATVTQLNALGGKETEINGHILGYDKYYKLYHNDCDNIRYFPDTLKRFKIPTSQNSNFVLAYNHTALQYRSYSQRLYPYLYSLKTQKISTYKVRQLTEIGEHTLVITPTYKKVVDKDMNEILPFKNLKEVVFKDNYYFFKQNKSWFRYYLGNQRLDTLKDELTYADPEKYVSVSGALMSIYTYENKLLTQSKNGFLDKLIDIEKTQIDYPKNITAIINRYKLDRLQEAWVKSIFLFSDELKNKKKVSVKYTDFPTKEYYEEQLAKTSSSKRDIFSDGYGSSGGDYFIDEMIDMEEGDYGSSKYDDYKVAFSAMNNAFESKLNKLQFTIDDFNYMKNGLVAFDNSKRSYGPHKDYELYIKLQDTGYQVWTFATIFDEARVDSLHKFLLHQISLNPSFWGVTCNEDMEKYDLNFFAARFRITEEYFTILAANYNFISSDKMKLTYADLQYFMTTEAQRSLASIF